MNNINIAPTNSSFWDIVNNGLDFFERTSQIVIDFKKQEAINKTLSQPNGLQFLASGYGLLFIGVIGIFIVVFKK